MCQQFSAGEDSRQRRQNAGQRMCCCMWSISTFYNVLQSFKTLQHAVSISTFQLPMSLPVITRGPTLPVEHVISSTACNAMSHQQVLGRVVYSARQCTAVVTRDQHVGAAVQVTAAFYVVHQPAKHIVPVGQQRPSLRNVSTPVSHTALTCQHRQVEPCTVNPTMPVGKKKVTSRQSGKQTAVLNRSSCCTRIACFTPALLLTGATTFCTALLIGFGHIGTRLPA